MKGSQLRMLSLLIPIRSSRQFSSNLCRHRVRPMSRERSGFEIVSPVSAIEGITHSSSNAG